MNREKTESELAQMLSNYDYTKLESRIVAELATSHFADALTYRVSTGTPVPKYDDRPFSGLPLYRPVVLDLTFRGYGISGQILGKGGDLLGIVDPRTPRFDPVPGSIVVMMDLGVALKKLVDRGCKFDLIVADVPPDAQCLAVGAFAQPGPPAPRGTRRLLLPGAVTRKADVEHVDLAKSVLEATEKLISDNGEALVRMHAIAFNKFCRGNGAMLPHAWAAHAHEKSAVVDVYMARQHRDEHRSVMGAAPRYADRPHLNLSRTRTPGQRIGFENALRT